MARLSRSCKLNQWLSRTPSGTVLRCGRGEGWYAIVRYIGTEAHHYHVLPTIEVEETLKP